jgi:parallel beta-helix repeat protein
MKGKLLLVLCLLLLLSCFSYSRFSQTETKALSGSPVHNLNTGLNYTTIQDAINANETLDGQTILVDAGVYNETIMINKSISLVGENSNNTIIDATFDPFFFFSNPYDAMVNITARNVTIANFNLTGFFFEKIWVSSCSNVTVRDNIIFSYGTCIGLNNSRDCLITGNTAFGTGLEGNDLIALGYCSGCVIDNNTVSGSTYYGITLFSSSNNLICNNVIFQNQYGIDFSNGFEGIIGSGNTVFHNNFEGNFHQVSGTTSGNYFNEASEGNYWSDYIGKDANQDGIGDTPYSNLDYYPLMGTFENFSASNYGVQTISNSTVSNFYFNGTAINFDVSGENGTTGFCRICIPTVLIGADYKILVNGTEVQYKLLPNSNSTQSYLYFTYHHSTQEVIITPEFPSFLILPLFMIATLLAVMVYKKKGVKTSQS